MTNLGFDVQDLYREQIDIKTGRYLFQGRGRSRRVLERDAIAVKGQAPEEFEIWVTRPRTDLPDRRTAHTTPCDGWAASGGPLTFPLLDIDRARQLGGVHRGARRLPRTRAEFRLRGRRRQYRLPRRGPPPDSQGLPGDVPLDGASGQCEWQGLIPFDDLPHVYNPASGMIVTANQNPFPADYPLQVDGRFGSNYRARQIRARLESARNGKPTEMLAVQKDVYSAFSHFLAGQVTAAWDKKPKAEQSTAPAVDLLRSWNGQMEKGTAAPMLFSLTVRSAPQCCR